MVESARALATFHDDPVALVTACRRVLSRQVTAGGLWWVCSRLLTTVEPLAEVHRIIEEVEDDTTARSLALALDPDATVVVIGWPTTVADALVKRGSGEVLAIESAGEGSALVRYLDGNGVDATEVADGGLGAAVAAADVVVVEAFAASPADVLAPLGALAAAAVGRAVDVPTWLVVPRGRALPTRVWDALISRWDVGDEPWDAESEVVPAALFDAVVGPAGRIDGAGVGSLVDCPIAPELFKADIT